jgi:hypothetical protein
VFAHLIFFLGSSFSLNFYGFLSLIDTEVDAPDDEQDDESENVNTQDL